MVAVEGQGAGEQSPELLGGVGPSLGVAETGVGVNRWPRGRDLRTGLASMRRSSSAAWRMRLSTDRQAITVSWPTWPRSSFCQRRTRLTVIARSWRWPKNGST